MQMQFFQARQLLTPYVKTICSMVGGKGEMQLPFRVLPDTCVELFISCNGKQIAEVVCADSQEGKMSFANFRMRSFIDVKMKEEYHCIAVCFYPGSAYRFFNMSMQPLSDSATGLTSIWGNIAEEMEDRIAHADNDNARVDIIQDYLVEQLMRCGQEDGLIAYSLQLVNSMKGQVSVKQLARDSSIGERQLHRRFMRYLGISPKEYISMNRFIHSLKRLKEQSVFIHTDHSPPGRGAGVGKPTMTDIAYASGYYDQAHFIHEYKIFAGMAPGEVLNGNNVIC